MKIDPNKICITCDCFILIPNQMDSSIYYGICTKSKFKNLVRYFKSTCIVDDEGNTL